MTHKFQWQIWEAQGAQTFGSEEAFSRRSRELLAQWAGQPSAKNWVNLLAHGFVWWNTGRIVHEFRTKDLSELFASCDRACARGIASVPTLDEAVYDGRAWSACIALTGGGIRMADDGWTEGGDSYFTDACVLLSSDGTITIDVFFHTSMDEASIHKAINITYSIDEQLNTIPNEIWQGTKIDTPNVRAELQYITRVIFALLWASEAPGVCHARVTRPPARGTRKARKKHAARRAHRTVYLRNRTFSEAPGIERIVPVRTAAPASTGEKRKTWAVQHPGARWVLDNNVADGEKILARKTNPKTGSSLCKVIRTIRGWGDPPEHAIKNSYKLTSIYEQ